jgi:hypothetical protein
MNEPVEFDPVRKQLFVESLTMGLGPVEAVKAAGFTSSFKRLSERLLQDEDVKSMLEEYKETIKAKYDVSRDSVLKHLVDAMEIAKIQADAKGMVHALKEISEVMGHHAPKQVRAEVHSQNVTQKNKIRQFSDEDLLELAGEKGFQLVELKPVTVDGELEDG